MKKDTSDMPEINQRVFQLIELQSNGSVNQFAKTIGFSQQKVNRFFNINKNNGKYPLVTTDILVAINRIFVNIDPDWLLSGRGEMYRSNNIDKVKQLLPNNKGSDVPLQNISPIKTNNKADKKTEQALQKVIATQERLIEVLEREIQLLRNTRK